MANTHNLLVLCIVIILAPAALAMGKQAEGALCSTSTCTTSSTSLTNPLDKSTTTRAFFSCSTAFTNTSTKLEEEATTNCSMKANYSLLTNSSDKISLASHAYYDCYVAEESTAKNPPTTHVTSDCTGISNISATTSSVDDSSQCSLDTATANNPAISGSLQTTFHCTTTAISTSTNETVITTATSISCLATTIFRIGTATSSKSVAAINCTTLSSTPAHRNHSSLILTQALSSCSLDTTTYTLTNSTTTRHPPLHGAMFPSLS